MALNNHYGDERVLQSITGQLSFKSSHKPVSFGVAAWAEGKEGKCTLPA